MTRVVYLEKQTPENVLITKNSNLEVALAHLFYAMAMGDKAITRDEKLKIASCTHKIWNESTAGKETDDVISKTLKELIARNVEAQKAFLVFSEFFYKNRKLFENSFKSQINATCNAIGVKKGKRSKMELIFISKLNSFFNPPEDLTPLSFYKDED
ncbi:hypothetical protein C8N46_107136 [Kordia periserrulae]|uniref:Tellurite resistance protein TerB n=1 Tax=Kordia periserrulae TaxID=701523 RepID=A0A2T6BVL9_9FLAO|nr:hypothetical protein [Kordia periserrulae]PTX60130.1 hypothetical protein C8N46_107136 [Kordia periserrulae]